jgi:glycosyltransferase involved in cell wall biosynthesis
MGIPVVYESRGFWEETWLSRTADQYGWSDLARLEREHGLPETYLWRQEREAEARERAGHVVTLARVMAERIVATGLPPARVTLAPNAVDVDDFPVSTRNLSLAGDLGIAPEEVVIGYISSLVEYEGIDTLIEAYGLVQGVTSRPVRLVIVGDGPERSNLEALVAQAGLEGVIFTGKVPHTVVTDYYSLIDVFVVPRRSADVCRLVTPLKPFEAFATGRALVLSDVEALREIAEDSGAALLFTAGDAGSLASVLTDLVDDPAKRQTLAWQGAQWVRKSRTWDANAEVYRQVYDNLVGPAFELPETAVRSAS